MTRRILMGWQVWIRPLPDRGCGSEQVWAKMEKDEIRIDPITPPEGVALDEILGKEW